MASEISCNDPFGSASCDLGLIGPESVGLCRADLRVSTETLRRYRSLLTTGERERGDRFRFADDARRFVVARAVLRLLLAKLVGQDAAALEFAVGPYGKPALGGDHPPQFSVSHSHELAAYALASRPVGLDVEHLRPIDGALEIASRTFTDAERTALEQASGDRRSATFLRCWTRKEAYVKATGAGLSKRLSSFSVAGDRESAIVIHSDDARDADRAIHVMSVAIHPDYACAMATTGPIRTLRQFDWLHPAV